MALTDTPGRIVAGLDEPERQGRARGTSGRRGLVRRQSVLLQANSIMSL
jgi:hypothetical protein